MNIAAPDYDRDIVTINQAIDLAPDIAPVIAATRNLVPGLKTSADLVPFGEDDGQGALFRAELHAKAPLIARFAGDISRRFASGTMAAVAPSLGLQHQSLDVQRFMLFALGYLLGNPTATEPRNRRVLWDVKPREATSGQFTTFSEDASEADLHTDSAFRADPEPMFFLYVVQAARCGGGVSYFANGLRVRDELSRTSRGRDTIDLLSRRPVPFRIPPAFSRDPNVAEYSAATVFADRPLIRFRHDVTLRALDAKPEPGNDELRDAVNLVARTALAVRTTDRTLPTGAIVFVDNHTAVHGRSRFRDEARHLIRVRIAT